MPQLTSKPAPAPPLKRTTPRRAGVLLHPTSLPGPHGVGDLGESARAFLRWLADAGQTVWQVLPLGPTGYGDSPFQALSAFAGNHLLLSPEDLREREGLLDEADLGGRPAFPGRDTEYLRADLWKRKLLARAVARLGAGGAATRLRTELEAFQAQQPWVADYALYAALKERYERAPWWTWPAPLAQREPGALEAARREHADEIALHVVAQWAFDGQWARLRAQAHELGIQIMGVLPMYLAHDSADVWARRELFRLDRDGKLLGQTGTPPDYYQRTGQLWGNPVYDWPNHESERFRFWVERMQRNLQLFDVVRLDHFRAYQSYWSVPADATTAENGRWEPAPAQALFDTLRARLRSLPVVVDNSAGTPEGEKLRRRFDWPGTAILQFAFNDDAQADSYQPHNYERDVVAYSGTHDNDTLLGWWRSEAGVASTRTAEQLARERAHARAYFRIGPADDVVWTVIQALYASVADVVITPLQDLLGLGSEARLNRPGTAKHNWRWRLDEGALTPALARRARTLVDLYGRGASPGSTMPGAEPAREG